LAGEVSDILLSGKSKLSEAVARLRNGTVFHFDEDPVRAWLRAHQNEKGTITWVRGTGSQNSGLQYLASADAVAWNILPGVARGIPGRQALMIDLMRECAAAQTKVATWFDLAIAGYLNTHGAVRHEPDGPGTQP
jgi:hypothetical protein